MINSPFKKLTRPRRWQLLLKKHTVSTAKIVRLRGSFRAI